MPEGTPSGPQESPSGQPWFSQDCPDGAWVVMGRRSSPHRIPAALQVHRQHSAVVLPLAQVLALAEDPLGQVAGAVPLVAGQQIPDPLVIPAAEDAVGDHDDPVSLGAPEAVDVGLGLLSSDDARRQGGPHGALDALIPADVGGGRPPACGRRTCR